MKMSKIVQIGDGQGRGDIVEAVAKDTIFSIIASADVTDCWKLAYEAQNPGYQDGICYIDLITGKIGSFAMSRNTRNQAVDNSYIELARVFQNEEDPYEVESCEIEEYIWDHINKEDGDTPDFPGLEEDWDVEDAEEANPEMYQKILDLLHENNKECWTSYKDDFDWEHIEEELDVYYAIEDEDEDFEVKL